MARTTKKKPGTKPKKKFTTAAARNKEIDRLVRAQIRAQKAKLKAKTKSKVSKKPGQTIKKRYYAAKKKKAGPGRRKYKTTPMKVEKKKKVQSAGARLKPKKVNVKRAKFYSGPIDPNNSMPFGPSVPNNEVKNLEWKVIPSALFTINDVAFQAIQAPSNYWTER